MSNTCEWIKKKLSIVGVRVETMSVCNRIEENLPHDYILKLNTPGTPILQNV